MRAEIRMGWLGRRSGESERKKKVPTGPLSIVRLDRTDRKTPSWKNQIEKVFRVGYYSRKDGLELYLACKRRGRMRTDHGSGMPTQVFRRNFSLLSTRIGMAAGD